MSWHTGGAAIEGLVWDDPGAVMAALGFNGQFKGQTVSGDEAGSSSLSGRAVARVGDWTFVWDPLMLMGDDPSGAFGEGLFPTTVEARLASLSKGEHRVFAFLTEGASGTHGYSVYMDGRRVRCSLEQEGASVIDEGASLPEEAAVEGTDDGEARVLGVLESITGVALGSIADVRFAVVE